MGLLSLPPELLEYTLAYLHPADIVHLGQTGRQARNITKSSNSVLWHTAFLHVFDDPRHAWQSKMTPTHSPLTNHHAHDTYWYDRLSQRLSALSTINPDGPEYFKGHPIAPEEIITTLLDIIETAKSGPTDAELAKGILPQVDDRSSLNLQLLSMQRDKWGKLEDLIHDSHASATVEAEVMMGHYRTRSVALGMRNYLRSDAACRLHVLYGRTVRERIEHGAQGAAREVVYDWNRVTRENDYGPFHQDGSGQVSWKVVEAVASIMLRHFEMGADGRIAMPQGFCYSIPYRTLVDPTTPQDWARVTGSWIGTYSFLDYADLFSYNTERAARGSLQDTPEAHGDLMVLELKLDPELDGDRRLRSGLPRCEEYPVLSFRGTSRSYDYGHQGLAITVIGFASMCPSGREVRWRYIISYRGQEQWQLEGVQPGGVRSGPVYGLWTQWGHDELSPVGAFLYVPEELCKKQELVLAR